MASLYSGFFLKDIYALLKKHSYAIGKLYRNGIVFKSYDPTDGGDLKGPNYIACRKVSAEMLMTLKT